MNPDEAKLLWDEYQYRHEHCWTTLFRLTAAAVVLGLAPYNADRDVMCSLGAWLLAPPSLALGLIAVGMLRMLSELRLLRQIRDCFRARQESVLRFRFPLKPWLLGFDAQVSFYLAILLLLSVLNLRLVTTHLHWMAAHSLKCEPTGQTGSSAPSEK